jgi:excisionase family DNA binding protein
MRPRKDHQPTFVSPEDGRNTAPREVTGDYLLTINETAERLRVSRWSVYNLIRANQLRTVKIGRRRLVTPAALTEYVKQLDGKAA